MATVQSSKPPVLTAPRVGLFGLLGSGNLGNDGSLDAVVAYLAEQYPDARLGFLCMGPEQVMQRYGVPAAPLLWYEAHSGSGPRVLLKLVGKALDPIRTLAWVRRHDVVIVPGMGVLEATLPLRPWGFPFALLTLCAAGRLTGTKVAFVSVGASVITNRATRWVITRAAKWAYYRSYRDSQSREAMRQMGVDVARDGVYPDLAFALRVPAVPARPTGAVGVGVMAYRGAEADRTRGDEIYHRYVDAMARFVCWLVDRGRTVRLFTGDRVDDTVVAQILDHLRRHRPELDPACVVAEPAASLDELMRQMSTVDTVVATRYHNVLCALKLAKPTVSIGYAAKNDVLMAESGLGDYCQYAGDVDVDRLVEQFTDLEGRSAELRLAMTTRNVVARRGLDHQFSELSDALFAARPTAEEA
ncbi:MAG: hypothetical protein GEU86_00200 [Actinophytocola sp.]|nr:hypothetical protein [Actinophytocola sp.]